MICKNREIQRDAIEHLVLQTLAQQVFDDRLLDRLAHEYKRYITKQDESAVIEKSQLEQALLSFDRQIQNIVNVMAQTGSIALAEKLHELEQNRETARLELTKMETTLTNKNLAHDQFVSAFHRAKALLASGSLSSKQQLVDQFVERVTIYTDRIEMQLRISNGFGLETVTAKNAENL